jgi:hypothetical protein
MSFSQNRGTLLGDMHEALRGLYQIPEPAGNHTETFTDIAAF